MNRKMNLRTGMLCLAAAITLLIAGCPLDEPSQSGLAYLPNPGTYYVEEQGAKVFYYQLAQSRGESGDWIELSDAGDWFQGAGFYVLDDNMNWSLDTDSAGLTLDEFIQLHDPAPAL